LYYVPDLSFFQGDRTIEDWNPHSLPFRNLPQARSQVSQRVALSSFVTSVLTGSWSFRDDLVIELVVGGITFALASFILSVRSRLGHLVSPLRPIIGGEVFWENSFSSDGFFLFRSRLGRSHYRVHPFSLTFGEFFGFCWEAPFSRSENGIFSFFVTLRQI